MKNILALSKTKVLTTLTLLFSWLIMALIAGRTFENISFSEWIFFPYRLYLSLYPMLRQPGYDDIMYGSELFPGSDYVALLATMIIMILGTYLFVSFIMFAVDKLKKTSH